MEEASDNRNKDASKRARTHEKEYVERDSKLTCSGTSTVPKMVAFENKKGDHIGLHFLSAQKRIIKTNGIYLKGPEPLFRCSLEI